MILVVYWYVQFKSLYKDFVIACILIDFYKYLGFCNDETIYFGTVWYIQSLKMNRIVWRGSEYLHLQKVSDILTLGKHFLFLSAVTHTWSVVHNVGMWSPEKFDVLPVFYPAC